MTDLGATEHITGNQTDKNSGPFRAVILVGKGGVVVRTSAPFSEAEEGVL